MIKNILILKNKKKNKYNNYNFLINLLNKNNSSELKNLLTTVINFNFKYSTYYNYVYSLNSFKKNIFIKNILKKDKFQYSTILIKTIKNIFIYNTNIKLLKLLLNNKFYNFYNSLIFLNFKLKAKSNKDIFNQLINFRGNIINNFNKIIQYPIINTFNKGLDNFEFIFSSYGTRKGLLDTSSNTSNSGYLNKKLMEYSNNIIINEFDCLSNKYINYVSYIINYKGFLKKKFLSNFINKYIYILFNLNFNIFKFKNIYFKFRNILSCINLKNICSKCYNIFTNNYLNLNIPIGIYITHSITEPLTQTTLKTFHTGGMKSLDLKYIFNIKKNLFNYNNKYFFLNFNFKNFNFNNKKKKYITINNKFKLNLLNYNIFNGYFIFYKNFNDNYKIVNIKNYLLLNKNNKYKILNKNDNLIFNNYIYITIIYLFLFKSFNFLYNNITYKFNNLILNINGFIIK